MQVAVTRVEKWAYADCTQCDYLGCYPGHDRRDPHLNPSGCTAIYAVNAKSHSAPCGLMHFFALTAADSEIVAAAAKYRPEK